MSWGFEVGRNYNRRADIHGRYGGQEQWGIITPANHNVIFIVSGKRGAEWGYNDRVYDDGRVEYFGQGQVGDMTMTRGNLAIANHGRDGKALLYFLKEYPARHVTFKGEMVCEGWHEEQSEDSEGKLRKALVFELRPIEDIVAKVEATPQAIEGENLATLRDKAFRAAAPAKAKGTVTRTVFERSADIRNYVLARASGHCEGCKQSAPFKNRFGLPYLEPHHIRRVSDGGLDDPRFVIAVCPNCHARVHRGHDGATYNEELLRFMSKIESH